MNPAILAWMLAVQQLIATAPDVIAFAAKVKTWITDLFSSGVITVEEQAALMARVNDICAAILTGAQPEHWKVEPDPE